ncbi:hypothetical protein P5673_005490 [Acropora cervicornis]|uniref:Uncharacterized protein n=1 Tax=Acropora cervicornis TaxID=6130 RepID=A0AAD9VCN4_ACRCE|nr:hypothetical protein P5673_005490 [Acropora cervicornis]
MFSKRDSHQDIEESGVSVGVEHGQADQNISGVPQCHNLHIEEEDSSMNKVCLSHWDWDSHWLIFRRQFLTVDQSQLRLEQEADQIGRGKSSSQKTKTLRKDTGLHAALSDIHVGIPAVVRPVNIPLHRPLPVVIQGSTRVCHGGIAPDVVKNIMQDALIKYGENIHATDSP